MFGRGLASNCFREPLSSYCLFDKGSEGWVFGVVLKQVLLKSVTPRMSYKNVITIVSYQWFIANVTLQECLTRVIRVSVIPRVSYQKHLSYKSDDEQWVSQRSILQRDSFKVVLPRVSCQDCPTRVSLQECLSNSVKTSRMSYESLPEECCCTAPCQESLTRILTKNVLQECHGNSVLPTTFSKIVLPRLFYKSVRPFYKSVIYNTA